MYTNVNASSRAFVVVSGQKVAKSGSPNYKDHHVQSRCAAPTRQSSDRLPYGARTRCGYAHHTHRRTSATMCRWKLNHSLKGADGAFG